MRFLPQLGSAVGAAIVSSAAAAGRQLATCCKG
jgi:hypothetical protein